jgi:hypothetical protein
VLRLACALCLVHFGLVRFHGLRCGFVVLLGVSGGFVLCGVPASLFERVCARLFVLGCEFVACGSSVGSRLVWLCFRCRAEVAARLALLFPAPPGFLPLLVSRGRVLSGAAESRARESRGGRGSLAVAVQVADCGSSF